MKHLFKPKILAFIMFLSSIPYLTYLAGIKSKQIIPSDTFASTYNTSTSQNLPACHPGEDRLADLIDEYHRTLPKYSPASHS